MPAKGVFQTGQWERSRHGSMMGGSLLAPCPQNSFTCLHEQTDRLEDRSLGLLVGVEESPLYPEDGATSCRILPMTRSH